MDFQLNDESGVLIEGFELDAGDPPAVAPAVLPAAMRGGRADQGDGPVQLVRSTSPTATRCCRSCRRSPSAPGPSTGSRSARCRGGGLRRDMDEFAKVYNAAWSENWGFVPYSQGGPRRATPARSSSSTAATGSWSPRSRGRPSRWRSRSRTSTRSQEDEGPAAAVRLVALPATRAGSSTACASGSSA